MYETEREAGVIPIPEKLLSKIHACELEMTNGSNMFKAAQKRGADLVESFLENACGIDLAAEKWEVETEHRRFRRADVRPPELRPENEVRPPSSKGATAGDGQAPRPMRKAPKLPPEVAVKPQNGKPTSATDYLPVEEKVQ